MQPWETFGLGCLGALAPEIVRLYSIRTQPSRFKWTSFYIVVSILFACLGGILAIVMPATTPWGALYIGISAPILVNSIAKKAIAMTQQGTRSTHSASPIRGMLQSFLEGW